MRFPIRATSGLGSPRKVSKTLWATTSYTLDKVPSRTCAGQELPSPVHDVAQYLHCHTSTLYRLVEHRQIPGLKASRLIV